MRVKEELKRLGSFWLPSAEERKIPGRLSISDGGNIELEVSGLFDQNEMDAINASYHLGRIVGQIEKEGFVTLEDCFYTNKHISLDGGISKATLRASTIYIGAAVSEKESILFTTLQFSVEGIDAWVGISGIEINQDSEGATTISYQAPEEIRVALSNGMHLTITFQHAPSLLPLREGKITQKIYFTLVSNEERKLEDFISIAHALTTFLCLAVNKPVCLDYMEATSNNIRSNIGEGKTGALPLRIYYRSLPYSRDEPKIELHDMLFRYGQISDKVEKIVNNWIDAYDRIGPALNLYFSTKTGAQKYLDGKFLALAQGLETYHRRTSDEKLMTDAKFEETVQYIMKGCPEEHKDWLEGRLKYGNEIPLGKRIKSILEPLKDVIGTSKQRCKLIVNIVDTRNYLTHYDESSRKKAASGRDLLVLCLKMEVIFQLTLLRVLGFTHEEIKLILGKSYWLKRNLSGTLPS